MHLLSTAQASLKAARQDAKAGMISQRAGSLKLAPSPVNLKWAGHNYNNCLSASHILLEKSVVLATRYKKYQSHLLQEDLFAVIAME
ncbi:uncharacterized protein PV06_00823 [Exophiala oligosperma]|uniref:Uncharacterized protein n=2 Tax=Chaetothyriales TaxID=34395 RepID=A0A0D2B7J6_9EURO|nr:uncharacterized protein PV06_00823 [Exophiala oligosperma]KAJ9633321.1 hypothetical protein H2204_007038 [Knufia peltigerae]KIW48211.1 hypothetical protein PV06_00823 [Exophiala oligosperma]